MPSPTPLRHAAQWSTPSPRWMRGVLGRLPAAHGAGVRHGLVPGQGHGAPLEGGLDLPEWHIHGVQGVEAVKDEGEKLRLALPLLAQRLDDLGKVAAQGELVKVPPHTAKLPLGQGLLHHPAALVFVERHLRPHQQLAGCGNGAALLPAAPGGHGEPALVGGEHREDLIRFLIAHFPEHKGHGGQMHKNQSSRKLAAAAMQSLQSSVYPKLWMAFTLSRQFSLTLTQVSR